MERDLKMDLLKGTAIIMVIIGHSLANVSNMSLPFNVIYSFHMPLLIFVSAYIEEFNKAKYVEKKYRMLSKRAIGLLLPYLSWTIINYLLSVDLSQINGLDFFNELIGFSQSGLWFLAVLFGLKGAHLLYWYIELKSKNMKEESVIYFRIGSAVCIEILILIAAAITRLPYIINMVSYAIPYFFGVILASDREIQKIVKSCRGRIITACIILYAIGIQYFSFYNTSWITQVIRIGLALCAIVVLFNFADRLSIRNQFERLLCFFGKHSLSIYLLHEYFIDYKDIYEKINSTWLSLGFSVIIAVGVSLMCILIEKIISLSPLLDKLLFGKNAYPKNRIKKQEND